jgi:hypothetical protein
VLYNHAAAVGVDEVPLRQLLQADQLFGDQPSDKIMRTG